MIKKLVFILALLMPVVSHAANKYMVENTTGTNNCYLFQTTPSCSARITNLTANITSGTIPSGSTNYIQNTANPTTATQIFSVSSGSVGNFTATSSTMTSVTMKGTIQMGANKITGLANGTAATDAAAFGQIVSPFQPVQFTTTASSSTASTSFISTNLTAAITPTNATHRIKVTVTGVLTADSTSLSFQAYASISRNGTNLGGANGFSSAAAIVTSAVVDNDYPCSFSYIDSPATTSALTYTVIIRSSNAALTASWLRSATTGTIILEEVL